VTVPRNPAAGRRVLGFALAVCLFPWSAPPRLAQDEEYEKGILSIYFMEEKVGYEEFTWRRNGMGIELTVEGRITKPVSMTLERLVIRMDGSFIPAAFSFKGSIGGVEQEIDSEIREGVVHNSIRVAGQERITSDEIRRDAFLLPNPVFSPYMAVTKKFRCSLAETLDLSAYIIPQVETGFTLQPKEGDPCTLVMELGAAQIELHTDRSGQLNVMRIPLQHLRIVRD
jgi:hypothetical protein